MDLEKIDRESSNFIRVFKIVAITSFIWLILFLGVKGGLEQKVTSLETKYYALESKWIMVDKDLRQAIEQEYNLQEKNKGK